MPRHEIIEAFGELWVCCQILEEDLLSAVTVLEWAICWIRWVLVFGLGQVCWQLDQGWAREVETDDGQVKPTDQEEVRREAMGTYLAQILSRYSGIINVFASCVVPKTPGSGSVKIFIAPRCFKIRAMAV